MLFKDLTLYPRYDARGQRLGLENGNTLRWALELDRSLTWAARPPAVRSGPVRLPRLWAGYRTSCVPELYGGGPEFEFECSQYGLTEEMVFRKSERQFEDLTLYPLEWVSHQLDLAVTVFAEMRGFQRRQVFCIERFPHDLIGYQGASEFDFYHSRYRRYPIEMDSEVCRAVSQVAPLANVS